MKHFTITTVNDFHDGWLSYLLNEPKPEGEGAESGWETADDCTRKEPHPLFGHRDLMAVALRQCIESGQIIVSVQDRPDDRVRPKITRHGNGSFTVEMPDDG